MKPRWNLSEDWSFANACGYTIMEKYESLYCKLYSISEELGGARILICCPEVSSFFTSVATFMPDPTLNVPPVWADVEMPPRTFYRSGRVNEWDVYSDDTLKNCLYVVGEKGVRKLIIPDLMQ